MQTTSAINGTDVTLVNADGNEVDDITIAGKGRYDVVRGASTTLRFTPESCFVGPAPAVTYRAALEDVAVGAVHGVTAASILLNTITDDATYTATVNTPAAPDATPLTSTGRSPDAQSATVTLGACTTLTLLDDGDPVSELVRPAEGTFTVSGGKITFTPVTGYVGTPAAAPYRLVGPAARDDSTYTPTVGAALPSLDDLNTSGALGAVQSTTAIEGTDVSLLDGDGDPVDTLTVAGKGRYDVVRDDETTLTFTPESCFVGTAPAVTYRATLPVDDIGVGSVPADRTSNVLGGSTITDTASYTATVNAPAAPDATALTSTGVAPAAQDATVTLGACTTLTLLENGAEVDEVDVAGGTYSVTNGTITFTPVAGYSGTPTPVDYRLNGPAAHDDSTYTPTVTAPPLPAAIDLDSTGEGMEPQTVQTTIPTGGTVRLLDGSNNPTLQLDVLTVGSYVIDPATGIITFVPAPGYSGTPAPVTYRITDIYNQTSTATYTVTVTMPAPPEAAPGETSGNAGQPQEHLVAPPVGGSITLLNADGLPDTEVAVEGQGVYTINPLTGLITFTPDEGFTGEATGVRYRVTDAYGRSDTSTYQPTVLPTTPPVTVGAARLTAPATVRSATVVPATCSLTTGRITSCTVTAYAMVGGKRVVVGTGTRTISAGVARMTVAVRLNTIGRALAARPGGVKLSLTAQTSQLDVIGSKHANARSHAVAPKVTLRPVYFDTDSAVVRPADRAYLTSVRAQLGGVRRITCVGFTDARHSSPYNYALGKKRAINTCAVLAKGLKIPATFISRGETRPVAPNTTNKGRAINRRAEVILSY